MYDIIGDIHGYCSKLEELLTKLGYEKSGDNWSHPSRKAIFVGDYIDRGPEIRETLHLVRNMVKEGSAIAVMGNHEYNALAYHYQLEDGSWLRSHSRKHAKQHEATLEQFAGFEDEWHSFLQWFSELPLFLDLGDIRVVHACWDQEHIDWLIENGHRTMTPGLLLDSHEKGTQAFLVIEEILKGKEINIPEEYAWLDKDGHTRTSNRYKWWVDPQPGCFGDFLFDCPPQMTYTPLTPDIVVEVYDKNAPPVFFGHYWLSHTPSVQAPNVICLDYSIAKNGALVAYRWNKGEVIGDEHLVAIQ